VIHDDDARRRWEVIAKHIPSLMAFFDAVILNERVPLFAYGATFPGDRILDSCGDLVVHVEFGHDEDGQIGEAYKSIKEPALEKVRAAPEVPSTLAAEIADELSAFGYEWEPEMGDLSSPDDRATRARTFLLGGFLFQGIARQISGDTFRPEDMAEHVVQPRRSSLLAAIWLREEQGGIAEREAELFAGVMAEARRAHGRLLAWEEHDAPSFLPALLGKAPPNASARDLLAGARAMKITTHVRDYRAWRRGVREAAGRGNALVQERRELQHILDSAARQLAVIRRSEVELAVKAEVAMGLEGPSAKLGAEAKTSLDLRGIGWWLTSHLPGRGHRELLTRLVVQEGMQGQIRDELRRIYFES
jgi:hypothetical protein